MDVASGLGSEGHTPAEPQGAGRHPGLWRQADRRVSPGKALPRLWLPEPSLGIYNTKDRERKRLLEWRAAGQGRALCSSVQTAPPWGGGRGGSTFRATGYHRASLR